MQPIRVTYNQTCELLSISRDALRLLVQQDPTFPRPIKYGNNRQSPVYFDYADLLEWHQKQKAIYAVVGA
ncbi:transcriptional regulator [Acinetobacter sp.]|uniref:helix-turn-helix transcriptional regulator n=1 Tax=Acinetobacter sp. TaxID=472 RepID=UPI0031D88764